VAEYAIKAGGFGELAPRGWAEIAVASLLALNEPRFDSLITAYCQEFGIGSRVASFLVLENDNDYKRLDLQRERGNIIRGDLGQFLDIAWQALGRAITPREAFERFLAKLDARAASPELRTLLGLLGDKDFELPEGDVGGPLMYRRDVPSTYLAERRRDPRSVAPFINESRLLASRDDLPGAVRVLSSIVEQNPGRSDALRLVGYRLLDLKQSAAAARLFRQVQEARPFEAHSYRDLARSLEECGRFGLAAVQYEMILAGTWDRRFHASLKHVAQEEYVHMMRQAVRKNAVRPELAAHFDGRLRQLGWSLVPSDLRVTISWNTDATDIDLWVIEPDGTKCFYGQRSTRNGGELSEDQRQGYGPERYQTRRALPGTYTVIVHNYRPNANLLGGETHVNVVVTRFAGTPQETVQRYNVILKRQDEQIEVCRVKF
jgi:tetratricopeptide (TPR) repeat protein